jgi:hypothetical protein
MVPMIEAMPTKANIEIAKRIDPSSWAKVIILFDFEFKTNNLMDLN